MASKARRGAAAGLRRVALAARPGLRPARRAPGISAGCSGEFSTRKPRALSTPATIEEVEWISPRMAERMRRIRCWRWASHGRQHSVAALGRGVGRAAAVKKALAVAHGVLADRPRRRRPCHRARASVAAPYTRMFLGSMKLEGALLKLRQHPGLFDERRLLRARATCTSSDNVFTLRTLQRLPRHRRLLETRLGQAAPARHPHPGAGAQRAQRSVRAGRSRSPRHRARSASIVTLWQPRHGGHVGFASGALPPGNALAMPTSVFGWLKDHNRLERIFRRA